MRIDKLLWYLRFAKSRSLAQAMVAEGHIRLNSRRIERAHHKVACGDIMVLPLPSGVQIVEIMTLPLRRGPAEEARECYRVLDECRPNPIAGTSERPDHQEDLRI